MQPTFPISPMKYSLEEFNHCLECIISASDTASVKRAEHKMALWLRRMDFIDNIISIMDCQAMGYNVRKLAALHLADFTNRVLVEKTQTNINISTEKTLFILKSKTIPLELKLLALPSLIAVLQKDSKRIIRNIYEQNFKSILDQAILEDNIIDIEFTVLLANALLNTEMFDDKTGKFLQENFGRILKAVLIVLKKIPNIYNKEKQPQYLLQRQITNLLALTINKICLQLKGDSLCLLEEPLLQTVISFGLTFQVDEKIREKNIILIKLGKIKNKFLAILTTIITTLYLQVNEGKHYCIILKTRQYLDYILCEIHNYSNSQNPLFNSVSFRDKLTKVYQLLTGALKINIFYVFFKNNRNTLVYDYIFKELALTKAQIELSKSNPKEFVNLVCQMNDQNKDDQTTRIAAAVLLKCYCATQDGFIVELCSLMTAMLKENINLSLNNSLPLLVFYILHELLRDRPDLTVQLAHTIAQLLNRIQYQQKQSFGALENKEDDREGNSADLAYALLLLIFSEYFQCFYMIDPRINNQSVVLIKRTLSNPSATDLAKIFVMQLAQNLCKIQKQQQIIEIIRILNIFVKKNDDVQMKIVDVMYYIFKNCKKELKESIQLVAEVINNMSLCIMRQFNQQNPAVNDIQCFWNVIREIGESQQFLPALIVPIEQAVLPILPYIDGIKSYDFEEDILMLMSCFIKTAKSVDANQQLIFEIIPRLFYNQYKAKFGHAFETMQLFIFYGKDSLKSSPLAIEAIIKMCLTSLSSTTYKDHPLTQIDNCEGVLLLQSLVLSCGQFFTRAQWFLIIKQITAKVRNMILFSPLIDNLKALLSMSLSYAKWILSRNQKEVILTLCLKPHYILTDKYAKKMIIFATSEHALNQENQDYNKQLFSQLFPVLLHLLASNIPHDDEQELIYTEKTPQQLAYERLLNKTLNFVKQFDQFTYFRRRIEQLQLKNDSFLSKYLELIGEQKLALMRRILAIENINDSLRQIRKVRRI